MRTPKTLQMCLYLGLQLIPGLLVNAAPQNLPAAPEPILAQTPASSSNLCSAQLGTAIEAIANRPSFQRARWGVLVQTLATTTAPGRTLYGRDAQQYFVPASSAKLLTTAAALHKLGPQFRIRTSVYRVNAPDNRTVLGVVGRGDPSLTNSGLNTLAQQISQAGIRQVDQLVGDDQYLGGLATNPNWEWEDVQAGYGAPANSLILNQNAVGLTLWPQALGQPLRVVWDDPTDAIRWRVENTSVSVGPTEEEFIKVGRDFARPILRVQGQLQAGAEPEPVAVAVLDPAENFVRQFQKALLNQQISVGRTLVATNPVPTQEPELAAIESPPVATLLVETNQESNNLYAEALLRALGATQIKRQAPAAVAGLAVVKATLEDLGVSPNSYQLKDGSGLSRHNLVSPEALVQTLQAIAQSPHAEVYRASLATAGLNGTLRNRFRNTAAQGILRAKTGTMSGTASLAGYLNPPNHPPLAFSLMVNQSDQPASALRQAIDEMVLLMTQLRQC